MIRGCLEHHMFEKMRQTSQALVFVTRSDVVPSVVGKRRRGVVFQDQKPQAVGEEVTVDLTCPEVFGGNQILEIIRSTGKWSCK